MSDFGISAAHRLFNLVRNDFDGPYKLTYSDQSADSGKVTDSVNFGNELVSEINSIYGSDGHSNSVSLDEFVRFASNDKYKTFDAIRDSADKDVIEETFKDISGDEQFAGADNIANYIRSNDSADGELDGHTIINFLI